MIPDVVDYINLGYAAFDPDCDGRLARGPDGVMRRGGGLSVFDAADRRYYGWREQIRWAERRIEATREPYGPCVVDRKTYTDLVNALNQGCRTLRKEALKREWFPWDRFGCVMVCGTSCPHNHVSATHRTTASHVRVCPVCWEDIAPGEEAVQVGNYLPKHIACSASSGPSTGA
jgi:hypothetical protein